MSALLGIWRVVKWIGGGVFEMLFNAVSALLKWMFSEWQNGPLLMISLALLAHVFLIDPNLRSERDEWRAEAIESLDGWFAEKDAHAQSIANFREATRQAQDMAQANAQRVAAEQAAINERNLHDYQARLGALRARYDELVRLRNAGSQTSDIAASGSGANPAGLSGASSDPASVAEATGNSGLPAQEPVAAPIECPPARVCLTLEEAWVATRQAVQLDALIAVVEEQQAVPFVLEGD